MQIWGEIHVTVDKTVKHDLHIKLLADLLRHQTALPSGFSRTLPFWRMSLITNSFPSLYSAPFFKKLQACLHAKLDG